MELFLRNLYKVTIYQDRWMLYIEGFLNTIALAVLACMIGAVIAMGVALINYFESKDSTPLLKVLAKICDLYVTVIRGTPVIIQLLIMYNLFFNGGFAAGVAAFGINSGAYLAEVIRAGIASVDSGQTEAGRSLGLRTGQTMWLIIFPQAIKNILPSLFNELISLLKETAVVGMIGVRDLTKVSDSIRGIAFISTPLFIAGAVYLIMVVMMTKVQKKLEKRLTLSDRS